MMLKQVPKRILIGLLTVLLIFQTALANTTPQRKNNSHKIKHRKIAADLNDRIEHTGGVAAERQQRVIVRLDDLAPRIAAPAKIARLNGGIRRVYNSFGLFSVELPLSRIRELAADDDIDYISPDRSVAFFGHLETTTAAAQVRETVSNTTLN